MSAQIFIHNPINVSKHGHKNVDTDAYTHVVVPVYRSMHVHTQVFMHHVPIHMSVHMSAHMPTHMSAHMPIHMSVYVHMFAHMSTHMSTCAYIYTHAYTRT